MKKLTVSQMEKIEGGRPFIGWDYVTQNCYAPDAEGVMVVTGTQTCQQNYFFWIAVGKPHDCGFCTPLL